MRTVALALKHTSLALLLLGSSLWMAGCGDSNSGDCTAMTVAGPKKVGIGKTAAFSAICLKSDGTTFDVTTDADTVWNSSDPSVATVAAGGQATGVKVGTTEIKATYKGGKSAKQSLEVIELVAQGLQIDPASATVVVDGKQKFKATVNYTDGTTEEVTKTGAQWSSVDETIATVDSTGEATGVKLGVTKIKATYGGKTAEATLTVSRKTVTRIEVTPVDATVPAGSPQQYAAEAYYDDNTHSTVTEEVVWKSSDTAIATIDSTGLATTKAVGTTKISATLGISSGETNLTVTEAELDRIEVEPSVQTVVIGDPAVPFKAYAIYKDTTRTEVTSVAEWTSSDTTKATVNNDAANSGADKGKVTAVAATTTAITIKAAFGGKEGTASVTVSGVVPVSVRVVPLDETIAKGTFQNFRAYAMMSDLNEVEVTDFADWQSLDTTKVIAVTDTKGRMQGIDATAAAGVTIRATYRGLQGDATLHVTAATLVSIVLTPAEAFSMPKGTEQLFTARGYYSDSTDQDISDQVTWEKTPAGSVNVLSFAPDSGNATAANLGTVTVTAVLGEVRSNSVVVTVTNAVLQTITVTPNPGGTMPIGGSIQFTAVGNYSDNTHPIITEQATWAASATVVDVSNAAGSRGMVTGRSAGTANITAAYAGVTSTPAVPVTVTAATLEYITIDPIYKLLAVGEVQQFTATGHYTDGTSFDITLSPSSTWLALSSPEGSNPPLTNKISVVKGLVTGVASTYGEGDMPVYVVVRQGTIQAAARVSVRSVTLDSISASCMQMNEDTDLACLPSDIGLKLLCTAWGNPDDGSAPVEVTQTASWAASLDGQTVVAVPEEGTVTIGKNVYKMFTIVGDGDSNITATQQEVPSNEVAVQGASMTFVDIKITNDPGTIYVAGLNQYGARGEFTGTGDCDGTYYRDITMVAGWNSSNSNIASIDNVPNSITKGLARGVAQGTTSITATYGTDSHELPLQVSAACITNAFLGTEDGLANMTLPYNKQGVDVPLPIYVTYSNAPGTKVRLAPGTVAEGWSGGGGCVYEDLTPGAQDWILGTGDPTLGVPAAAPALGPCTITYHVAGCEGSIDKAIQILRPAAPPTLQSLSFSPVGPTTIQTSGSQDYQVLATFTGTVSGTFNVTRYTTNWMINPYMDSLDDWTPVLPGGTNYPAMHFEHDGSAETGTTTITANYLSQVANTQLTVDGRAVTGVEITGVKVGYETETWSDFPVGLKLQFVARVDYTNGVPAEGVDVGVAFTSGNNTALHQNGTANDFSTAAASDDPITVTASIAGFTDTYQVTINEAVVEELSLRYATAPYDQLPDPWTLPVSSLANIMVWARYTGGAWFDVSTVLDRYVSNTANLQVTMGAMGPVVHSFTQINNDPSAPWTLTFGKTPIMNKVQNVLVTDKCVTKVDITPATATIGIGGHQNFTAWATYSDGSGGDATEAVGSAWDNGDLISCSVGGGVNSCEAGTTKGETTVSFSLTNATVCNGGDIANQTVTTEAAVTVTDATITSVAIVNSSGDDLPGPLPLPAGERSQLFATALYSDGTTDPDVYKKEGTHWASNSAAVTVSATGEISGVTAGQEALITVTTANGKTDTIVVKVESCPIWSVNVTGGGVGEAPDQSELPVGQMRRFAAWVTYASNATCTGGDYDVTSRATWSFTPTNVLEAQSTLGLFKGAAGGTVTVNAQYRSISDLTPPNFDVVAVELTGLHVVDPPSGWTTAVGDGTALTVEVTGIYTEVGGDGSVFSDLDPPAIDSWNIGDSTVLSMAVQAGSNNRFWTLTGLKAGTTTIRAQSGDIYSDDGAKSVTVRVACITGVRIINPPGNLTMPMWAVKQFEVECDTSDGKPLPCVIGTNVFLWEDSYYTCFDYSYSLPGGSTFYFYDGIGRLNGSCGTGTEINVYAYVENSGGACAPDYVESDATTVTVGDARLTSLELTPATAESVRGGVRKYTTTGVYSNNERWDLTLAAYLYSSNPAIAWPVGPATPDEAGSIEANSDTNGTTNIYAYYWDNHTGLYSNFSLLTVTDRQLESIEIVPASGLEGTPAGGAAEEYPAGYSYQMMAIAHYSDGSGGSPTDDNITGQVDWSLVAPMATGAQITTGGMFTAGSATGTQVIKAALNGVEATITIAFRNATLNSIEIRNIPSPAKIPDGVSRRFTGYVTLAGGYTYEATTNLTWASSATGVGTIVPSGAEAGMFDPVDPGLTNITVSRAGTSITGGPIQIEVTDAVVESIYCRPAVAEVTEGSTVQLHAFARLSDSTEAPITTDPDAGWFVYSGSSATVNSTDQKGLVWADHAGTTIFSVSYQGMEPTVPADRCVVNVTGADL